ncbi:MAG: PaaI family thioesterase [Clostridiaceae bacterium]|nr:PaaI family thioesterase [Clostridiaceae bacterium]
MKYKITRKQENSSKCIVCGLDNKLGLKASFYELENGELVSIFTPIEEHQSYPGRLHGGVTASILDETIGRAIMIKHENIWGVTIELNLKYRKPIPLNEELRVVGRITKDGSRIFEGTGEIILKTGEVAVTAVGKYFKMPIGKIADVEHEHMHWEVIILGNEPEEIEI